MAKVKVNPDSTPRQKTETKPQETKDGKKVKPKKKKHGCRNCFIAFIVIIVVINAGILITGDIFARKYISMSIWDCFGVIGDLRSVNSKKIVTNKYSDNDYNKFNTEFKRQLFLKSDVDFGIDKLLTALVDNTDNSDETPEGEQAPEEQNGRITKPAVAASVDTNGFLQELTKLYVRDNLDLSRLSGYSPDRHDEYVMHVSDKMIASALNKVINELGGIDAVRDMLKEYKVEKLSDVLKIEQMILGTTAGKLDGIEAQVNTVKVTVSLGLRSVATSYLKELTGKKLGFLSKMFLPKRLYVTVVLPVYENAEIEHSVYINNMNAQKMNRAYKLIDNVTSLSGSSLNAKQTISDTIQKSMGSVMGKVDEIFPLSKATDGVVKFDAFETALNLSKINEEDGQLKPDDKIITAPDVINTLSAVVASSYDDAIKEQYDFKNMYYDDKSEKVVYVKTYMNESGLTKIDYADEFMTEIASKYALDLTRGTADPSDDITFDDLMRLFGLGEPLEESKELELLDLFDGKRLSGADGVLNKQNKKVLVNSRMLGAILDTQINSMLPEGSTVANYAPELQYIYTYGSTVDGKYRNFAEVAIAVNTASLLPGDGGVGAIIGGLLEDKIIITFNIDITPNSSEYAAGSISYNGLNKTKTDAVFKLVSAFVNDFDSSGLLRQIEQPMRDAINGMNDVIDMKICSSLIDLDAMQDLPPAIEFSDIFSTVKNMLFKEDENISARDIEDVLTELSKVNEQEFVELLLSRVRISIDEEGVANYDASLEDLKLKYYLVGNDLTFDLLFGDGGKLSSDFNAANFDTDKLKTDPRAESNLRPVFTDGDIAALVYEKMKEDTDKGGEAYKDLLNIKGASISENSITIIFELNSAEFLDSSNIGNARLLPADVIYLKAVIDINTVLDNNGENYYKTNITLNDMSSDTYAATLKILDSLNKKQSDDGEKAIDLDTVSFNIGSLVYEKVNDIRESIGEVEFINGGMRFPSVYSFIKLKLLPDSTATPEQFKSAIQGLAAKEEGSSDYNYSTGNIVVNQIADTVTPVLGDGKIKFGDRSFGYVLKNGFTLGGFNQSAILADDDFTLTQLNILCGNDARKAHISSFNGKDYSADTLIEFTFSVNLQNLGDGKFKSVLSDTAYVSVVFKRTSSGFGYEYFRINELTEADQNLLMQLGSIDEEEDIRPQIVKCETALSAYTNAEFGSITAEFTDGGRGYVAV